MNEEDKSTSVIPPSKAELTLGAINRRDRIVKGIILIMAFVVSLLLLLGTYQLQLVLQQNQKDALSRSKDAAQDRQELKSYIKCLSLIRYDLPADQLADRNSVVKALDNCALRSKVK